MKAKLKEVERNYLELLHTASLVPRPPPGCPGNTLSVVARLQELLIRELDRLKCKRQGSRGPFCTCSQCVKGRRVKKFMKFVSVKIKHLAKHNIGKMNNTPDIWNNTAKKRPADTESVPRYI